MKSIGRDLRGITVPLGPFGITFAVGPWVLAFSIGYRRKLR